MKQAHFIAHALCIALFAACGADARGAVPTLLQSNDVVCLVGGANTVAAQRYGYLETVLKISYPRLHLRIRSLAHEGDTVYEQPRDYNYPDLEKQLNQCEATVVLAQFGQMEALEGTNGLAQFISAYDKLLARLAQNERRVAVISPFAFESMGPHARLPNLAARNGELAQWVDAIKLLCSRRQIALIDLFSEEKDQTSVARFTGDGLHLTAEGHWKYDLLIARSLGARPVPSDVRVDAATGAFSQPDWERIRQAVVAKNRLWLNYYRPMNWAFLGGDRTDQPSSRDHINPKIRWFPDEMKRFEPLLEQAEVKITQLATVTRGGR